MYLEKNIKKLKSFEIMKDRKYIFLTKFYYCKLDVSQNSSVLKDKSLLYLIPKFIYFSAI